MQSSLRLGIAGLGTVGGGVAKGLRVHGEKLGTRAGTPLAALEALLRLRQAACHSGLVPGHEAASSAKVERLVQECGADGFIPKDDLLGKWIVDNAG